MFSLGYEQIDRHTKDFSTIFSILKRWRFGYWIQDFVWHAGSAVVRCARWFVGWTGGRPVWSLCGRSSAERGRPVSAVIELVTLPAHGKKTRKNTSDSQHRLLQEFCHYWYTSWRRANGKLVRSLQFFFVPERWSMYLAPRTHEVRVSLPFYRRSQCVLRQLAEVCIEENLSVERAKSWTSLQLYLLKRFTFLGLMENEHVTCPMNKAQFI